MFGQNVFYQFNRSINVPIYLYSLLAHVKMNNTRIDAFKEKKALSIISSDRIYPIDISGV